MVDIERIEAVAANIGSGELRAGIIAGHDVINIHLDDEKAADRFFDYFRAVFQDQNARSFGAGEKKFALAAGDTALVTTDAFAGALVQQAGASMDRYRMLLFKLWQDKARLYVRLGARETGSGFLPAVQPPYAAIKRTEQGYEVPTRYEDVRDAATKHQTMSLVGEPGSGKTTALQVLALGAAQAAKSEDASLPFWVPLSDYRTLDQSPQEFLAGYWRQMRAPGDFTRRLLDGRLVLLLDALNEMPWHRSPPYRDWAHAWDRACARWAGMGNHIVVTCRTLDNSQPLDMQEVRLERFDRARIREFLRHYIADPAQAEALYRQLEEAPERHRLFELFGVPYYLTMLVEVAWAGGGALPHTRAGLFTEVVRTALVKELHEKNNPHLTEALLNIHGRRRSSGRCCRTTRRWRRAAWSRSCRALIATNGRPSRKRWKRSRRRRRGAARLEHLRAADAHLNKLRLYLRFAHRRRWLNDGQYRHVSAMVAEIGRLLGGWLKANK